VVVALAVAAGAWAGGLRLVERRCTGQIRLAVAAAPEIAPAIRSAVAGWVDTAAVDGTCIAVDVTARAPAEVAAAVAAAHGARLVGLGGANSSVQVPQVWVPDSSLWRLRLEAAAAGFLPADRTSIALSPVVLAVPQPVANSLVPRGTALTWEALVRQARAGAQISAGVVNPARDAAGLLGLLAFGQGAAKLGPGAQAATVSTMRMLAKGSSAVRDDLLSRFPRSLEADDVAASLTAAVLSEQAVIDFNALSPGIALAARYVAPAPPALDYPFLVMPGAGPAVSRAAAALRTALASADFLNALARQGLRGPEGTVGAGFHHPNGALTPTGMSGLPGSAAARVDLAAVDRMLGAWLALTQPGRILAVVDTSRSMLAKVPTAGNRTREQVTVDAATRGLELFDDSWALGLWIFSTNLDGPRDYREILPVSPLAAARSRAAAGLAGIRPKPDGRAGLYDTVYAAYREMQNDWRPGRLNTVVILTVGVNEDSAGLSLPALVTALGKLKDPKRPVDIVAITIGANADEAALRRITDTTGGGVFAVPDPADVGTVFLKALALHTQLK
jgi:Ca-activated chloride channel family protein